VGEGAERASQEQGESSTYDRNHLNVSTLELALEGSLSSKVETISASGYLDRALLRVRSVLRLGVVVSGHGG
jgi:hypothetical protein